MENITKDIAVLEIRNRVFKLLVGYLNDGKINCLYRKTFPLSCYLNGPDILNKEALVKDIMQIAHIEDVEQNLKLNIKEVVLIYPGYGLHVYQCTKTTNTVSRISKIDQIDIDNVISIVRKEKVPGIDSKIVEILPNQFIIDSGNKFVTPPIGEISSAISLDASVYVLPIKMVSDYRQCVEASKINVVKEVIAPIGLSYYLQQNKYKRENFFLIDCGYKSTTISLVGNFKVTHSTYLNFGYESLINKLVEKFEISEEDAYVLLKKFGLDLRVSEYNPPIIKKNREGGLHIEFKRDDLNSVITNFYQEFINNLVNCFSTTYKNIYNANFVLPLVFYGEGFDIKGVKEFLKSRIKNSQVDFLSGNVVGVDNSEYLNCIGALYYASVYKGSIDDINMSKKITNIKRESDISEEYDETKDEL